MKQLFRIASFAFFYLVASCAYAATATAKFADDSYAEIQVPSNWCSKNYVIYAVPCSSDVFQNARDSYLAGFITIMPFESNDSDCKSPQKLNVPSLKTTGKICAGIHSEESESGTGTTVSFQVANKKLVRFFADSEIWNRNREQILTIIRTIKYVEKP